MTLEKFTCTGVSLQNKGISLNRTWYTVVGPAANYLSKYKNGDEVLIDFIEQDGKKVVKFVGKDKNASAPQQTARENYNPQGAQQQTDFNPAFFGMCCNQAMELTIATTSNLQGTDIKMVYDIYKNKVLALYDINAELRAKLMEENNG